MASPNENSTPMKTDPGHSNPHLESEQEIAAKMSELVVSNPTPMSTSSSSSKGNF
jgi:hypothetical protein